MRTRRKRPGIVGLLQKAIAEHERLLNGLRGDNPQIVEMRLKATGRLDAYSDCLDALRGNTVMLRIAGGDGE